MRIHAAAWLACAARRWAKPREKSYARDYFIDAPEAMLKTAAAAWGVNQSSQMGALAK